MTGDGYLLLGYVIGLGLLLGYAVVLWLSWRALDKRERNDA